MRNSRAEAAQSRERIVIAAARMFRADGIDAVSVGDVMKKAGMTHGGFYKHFASKEALVAEACGFALRETRSRLRIAGESAEKGEELKAIVDTYLSERHVENPAGGCALAALGGELGRANSEARKTLDEGRAAFISLIAQYWKGPDADLSASAFVSALVGAVINARIAGEDRRKVLRAARHALHQRIEESQRAH
jgi:TetR/AcrR family transcriptional repressor of nem operon